MKQVEFFFTDDLTSGDDFGMEICEVIRRMRKE